MNIHCLRKLQSPRIRIWFRQRWIWDTQVVSLRLCLTPSFFFFFSFVLASFLSDLSLSADSKAKSSTGLIQPFQVVSLLGSLSNLCISPQGHLLAFFFFFFLVIYHFRELLRFYNYEVLFYNPHCIERDTWEESLHFEFPLFPCDFNSDP